MTAEQEGMNKGPRTSRSIKKVVCGAGGVVLCILSCLLPAPSSLEAAALSANSTGEIAMRVLGITLLAILWWIGEVVPDWVVSLTMLLLWILIGSIPFSAAFSAFSNTSIWLTVGAFCLAAGISKTGLFKRISWFLIRLFSSTFRGLVLAMLLTGTVCAPLVPSATAKAVLGASIAKNLADTMGYEPESRGRCGLFIASFIGFAGVTPAFMSGCVSTITLLGVLPKDIRGGITWTSWLIAAVPWLLIVLAGSFIFIQILFAPEEAVVRTREYVRQEYARPGKMGRREGLSAFLLAFAVLLWILESRLHIHAAVTALAVVCLLFGTGILEAKEISTAVPWGLVLFLGGVLNLGNVFAQVGLDVWLPGLFAPILPCLDTPLAVMLAAAVMTVLLRMILVSQTATVIIMMAILTPISLSADVNPFAVGFVVVAMHQCWFLSYHNTVFSPALSSMQGSLSHHKTVFACVIFEVVSFAGCCISLPLWKYLGLIS